MSFILISPKGDYAKTCSNRGGFSTDQSHNAVIPTDQLDQATVFEESDRQRKPYKYAIDEGYVAVPAYVERKVIIGINNENRT